MSDINISAPKKGDNSETRLIKLCTQKYTATWQQGSRGWLFSVKCKTAQRRTNSTVCARRSETTVVIH